jgi:hypothetical protein
MIDSLQIAWQSLKDVWDDFVLLLMLNLLWSLTFILMLAPIVLLGTSQLILGLILSFLLFWLMPIVSGGLAYVTNQIARGIAVGMPTFVAGVKRYWAKSLIVALINIVVLLLIATNLQFYGFVLQGTWTNFALAAWLVVGLYWLIVQIYWFPMILELENEKVLLALRNALALVLISPVFSITTGLVVLILVVVSMILVVPAPLLLAGLVLLISNRATLSRLEVVRKKRDDFVE